METKKETVKPKRRLKSWSREDIEKVVNFLKKERSSEEKKKFAKSIDRTWEGIYNKYYDLKKKGMLKPQADIVVTHIDKQIHQQQQRIKLIIGDATIEVEASKIKVNGVTLEV